MSQITTFSLILASKTYQNHPHQGWWNNPNNIECTHNFTIYLSSTRQLSHLLTYFSFNVDLDQGIHQGKTYKDHRFRRPWLSRVSYLFVTCDLQEEKQFPDYAKMMPFCTTNLPPSQSLPRKCAIIQSRIGKK